MTLDSEKVCEVSERLKVKYKLPGWQLGFGEHTLELILCCTYCIHTIITCREQPEVRSGHVHELQVWVELVWDYTTYRWGYSSGECFVVVCLSAALDYGGVTDRWSSLGTYLRGRRMENGERRKEMGV